MTNCVTPPAPADQALLASLDGEADQQLADHVAKCPACRERALALAQIQNELAARLYRLTCPSPVELGDYALRVLSTTQKVAVAQHLRECPHCQREVSQIKSYLSELAPPLEHGPLEQVKFLFARLAGQAGQLSEGMARVPAFGMLRGGSEGPITLEADGLLIVLDIQPAQEGRRAVVGQVAADRQDQWLDARVELHQNGKLQLTTLLDDLGAFRCEGVLPGRLELKLIPIDGPIVLANIEIGG